VSLTGAEAARPLAWSRIALGTLFLLRTTPVLMPLGLSFTADTYPLLGWPSPVWHGSPVWGLGAPPVVIAVTCVIRTVAALCFTLGYRVAWAGAAAGLSGYFLLLQQPFGFNATLHLLFQGVMLVGLTDAGAALAVRPVPAKNPASGKLLIRAFLASIYFWAAVVKLRADWLDGRTLALFHENGALSGVVADLLLSTAALRSLIACSIVVIELSLPVLLFAPRTRRWAPFVALSLHVCIDVVAAPDLIGWAMAALLLSTLPRSAA
jgi:hypothetical protein